MQWNISSHQDNEEVTIYDKQSSFRNRYKKMKDIDGKVRVQNIGLYIFGYYLQI